MNEEETFRAVLRELFGTDIDMSLEEGAKVFSQGVKLPVKKKTLGGDTVYTIYDVDKYVSEKETTKMVAEDTLMRPKEDIKSLKDVEKMYGELNSFLGSKTINATNVRDSDNVLGSSHVYLSQNILSSKYIGFSENCNSCEYVYGSKFMADSSFCIRCQDSSLTNCFEVSWSAKCSNCFYCHNCFDLQDCMFCFHLASKQYCIANRQYTKEEYEKAKKMVVEHLLKNKFRVKFFPVL